MSVTTLRCLFLAAAIVSLLACASSPQAEKPGQTRQLSIMQAGDGTLQVAQSLRLISLNLAHGRKDSLNQLLVSGKRIRQNLDDIAAFLRDKDADIVALQEADGASPWSGGFDHVGYLARAGGYPYYVHTEHAHLWLGNYGTAILSRVPIESAIGHTFAPTFPTASKGLTLAQLRWHNGDKPLGLDVVSVHLDFSRKSVRQQQLNEMVELLRQRHSPLVIMGDFNSEWLAEKYLVESFADSSQLHVYNVVGDDLNTYKKKRLDWILLSRDLVFNAYSTAPEVLSDHRAVIAEIGVGVVEREPR